MLATQPAAARSLASPPVQWLLTGLLTVCFALTAVIPAASVAPVKLQTLATGLENPTSITHAGDNRLFVTLQSGLVLIWDGQQFLPQPFLDISDRVEGGGERGLLSIAFHPNYSSNGFFYAYYTDLTTAVVISRFQVSQDPDRALPASEAPMLRIGQPFGNHNGGQLQFGPDGYLYAAPGDGGAGNDPQCLAQTIDRLLGKLMRLDVDQNVNAAPFHGIPADNPFAGPDGVRDEIWALGLRNPWRFSFDRLTGDLYIGDVGQDLREEVNRQPAGSPGGQNYGWKMMEGLSCTNGNAGCPAYVPPCDSPDLTAPILQYFHIDDNCSITGGYVYRGSAIPGLTGAYLYGDLCSGRLWAAENGPQGWASSELAPKAPTLTSFGEDRDGEIYLVANGTFSKLVLDEDGLEPCVASSTTACLNEDRFRVEVSWRTQFGIRGSGQAINLTDDSAYFWFFDPENPEIFVKVRNACADPFNRYWVFVAGLTNVEVDVTVTDTTTGASRSYINPLGRAYVAVQDTDAFEACP